MKIKIICVKFSAVYGNALNKLEKSLIRICITDYKHIHYLLHDYILQMFISAKLIYNVYQSTYDIAQSTLNITCMNQ